MRLAPVPMLLHLHPPLAVAVAGETSRTTHASPAAVDACRYFAGLVRETGKCIFHGTVYATHM